MKKFLGLAVVSMAIFACNDTQTPSINDDTRDSATVIETAPPASTDNVYMPAEGDVTYKDSKVLVMKNGEWVEAKEDVKLDNGVVIYRTGKAKKDGKEIVIEEGYVVNKEGNIFDKTGHALENAWDATKDGVKKAGNEIEKGADKAKDAVDGDDHHDDEKK